MPTPREDRASARDERRNLQLPIPALGRSELIRSRSPSPNPIVPGRFNFPTLPRPEPHQFENAPAAAEMATQEQLDALREQLRNQLRDEVRNETAVAAASMPDAIRKKPEIPPFDKNHV